MQSSYLIKFKNFNTMKPAKSIMTFLALAATFMFSSCDKEVISPVSELPQEITNYITTHFPSNSVVQFLEDTDGFIKTYDIVLSDGISLEFNRKKEIINIDGLSSLPSSVIPAKISEYVSGQYPGNSITDWELDGKNQQIELDNGLDLEFNMNGDFLRIDN